MNSGFDPMIVAPSLFRRQTASQQTPFHFGGSQVPLHLGMSGGRMASKPPPRRRLSPPLLTPQTRARIMRLLADTMPMLEAEENQYGESEEITRRMNLVDEMEEDILNMLERGDVTEQMGLDYIRMLNRFITFRH